MPIKGIDWLKRVYLRRVVGYLDPQAYWDRRWALNLQQIPTDYTKIASRVHRIMQKHKCGSVLEIGCGKFPLRTLPGYIGLDFSTVALADSGLREYIVADITERIPLPDRSVDAVYCGAVLLHIPPDKIGAAVAEIGRVASGCVILLDHDKPFDSRFNCYSHDYRHLFGGYSGALEILPIVGGDGHEADEE